MKNYDFALSFGFSCGGSMALRAAGLQFSSFPFDWTGAPGIAAGARTIAAEFDGWMERGDLVLHDIRRGGFDKHVYRNVRTGYGFPHDFSSFRTFDENFPEIAEKYRRRVTRLLEALRRAKRVLVVYVERPIWCRGPDDELLETRRILQGKFPAISVDILYFHQDAEGRAPVEVDVAEGITAVACDYRKMDHGEVSHAIDIRPLVDYLKAHVSVIDGRSEDERLQYARGVKERKSAKWGGGGFIRRKLNQLEYRLFRNLERDLTEKGMVPRERPMWFPPERSE